MTSIDKIRMDAHLFDLDFALGILKDRQKDDDDEYAAAYSIVYEQFKRLKDYCTHSPIIYRGEQKTLKVISDTLDGEDVGYFTDGDRFYNIADKSMRVINEMIHDDRYVFIRFFEGRADYEYVPYEKKEDNDE